MSDVFVEPLSLDKYAPIIGETKIGEIKGLADKLAGKSICHVNSTSFGGGVAEILHRLVPLMRDVGLKSEWRLVKGSDEFFNVTKAFHNGLQGMKIPLTDEIKRRIKRKFFYYLVSWNSLTLQDFYYTLMQAIKV